MYQFSISLQSMEKSHWVLERSDFMFIPLQKHKALGICQWNSNLLWLLEFQRLNFTTRIKYKLHSSFCMKLGLEGSWMWSCQAAVVPNSRFTRSRAELVFLVHTHTLQTQPVTDRVIYTGELCLYRHHYPQPAPLGHGHQKWPGPALVHLIISLQACYQISQPQLLQTHKCILWRMVQT